MPKVQRWMQKSRRRTWPTFVEVKCNINITIKIWNNYWRNRCSHCRKNMSCFWQRAVCRRHLCTKIECFTFKTACAKYMCPVHVSSMCRLVWKRFDHFVPVLCFAPVACRSVVIEFSASRIYVFCVCVGLFSPLRAPVPANASSHNSFVQFVLLFVLWKTFLWNERKKLDKKSTNKRHKVSFMQSLFPLCMRPSAGILSSFVFSCARVQTSFVVCRRANSKIIHIHKTLACACIRRSHSTADMSGADPSIKTHKCHVHFTIYTRNINTFDCATTIGSRARTHSNTQTTSEPHTQTFNRPNRIIKTRNHSKYFVQLTIHDIMSVFCVDRAIRNRSRRAVEPMTIRMSTGSEEL